MKFVMNTFIALRLVCSQGTGRLFLPLVALLTVMATIETESLAVGIAGLVGAFIWVGMTTRSPHLQARIEEYRRKRSKSVATD